ncbi:MAG TPA: ATP synthase F1 subunit delta [Candidatus Binatia bacterium]|nr:ATP synthase F1 subunit delta [Candidatus Binatia bacterium]
MSAVAKRYAKALLALAVESGEGETVGRELDRVVRAFAAGPLQAFASDTTLDRNTRRAVAARLSEALGASRLLRNFLGVLAENNRLRDLPAIRSHYERLEDHAVGRVRARVLSAQPLSEESRSRIHEVFERQTGKRVIAEAAVAPELLGGAVVELQGRVFDGSLRTQLERLRRSLSG